MVAFPEQAILVAYTHSHFNEVSSLGKVARGLFQIDALFCVAYASTSLWLLLPEHFTNYKLEFMTELLLMVMRVLFCANLAI